VNPSTLTSKLFVALGAVVALTGLLQVGPAVLANAATTVPWTDPHVHGSLTLCNRDDKPVTSGSLLTVPFVWSAVSSSAAPTGYTGAYLVVYQPIQYVDPADWSGYQLTDESVFSNRTTPKAQATNADLPLLFADHNYPPHWDNLYQLRMYFTGVNKQAITETYPAAVVRVSGNQWSLVQGGSTPCNSGTATSLESVMLPKSETGTQHNLVVGAAGAHAANGAAKVASAGKTPETSTHSQSPGPATTITSNASATGSGKSLSAAGSGSKGSGPDPVLITVLIVVIAGALAGAGFFFWRRKHVAPTPSG
jgi:hypothetical protein